MNSHRIEVLLDWIKGNAVFPSHSDEANKSIDEAIRHLRNRRRAAAKRKAFFRLRADEQRELLR